MMDALDEAAAYIDEHREAIQAILDERVQPILDAADGVELPELPDAPEPEVDTDAQPLPLINSGWPFAVQTDVLLVGVALPVELVSKHHYGVALTRVLFLIVRLAARGSHFFMLCQ
jgi:hypothetical protein